MQKINERNYVRNRIRNRIKNYITIACTLLFLGLCFTSCRNTALTESTTSGETVETTPTMETPQEAEIPETVVAEYEESENILYASVQQAVESPDWVRNLAVAKDVQTKQLFVVAGMGLDKTTASVSMHERDADGEWRQIMSTPGFVGIKGMCPDEAHAEGCGQTPMGIYHFMQAFGIADDPGCSIPYTKVTDDMYWSGDDRKGMHYNEMINIKDFPDLDLTNSEHLIEYEYQYQYCLNISFNEEGTPGKGSAIFLHCLGKENPYSGGCVSIPEYAMRFVMQRVEEDCVVVMDTLDDLKRTAQVNIKQNTKTAGLKMSNDASGFVLLSEAVPDAILEMRYYSTYNFVGERIDGYTEPVALLTKEAAAALNEVSKDLMQKGYRLKIYDAYRPQKAVEHFMRWAQDVSDTRMKPFFYPDLDKAQIIPQGYIAARSNHSRGSTVDLTLFDMKGG